MTLEEALETMTAAQVVAAIYNKCSVRGMGVLAAKPGDMTEEEAMELIEQHTQPNGRLWLDYVHGRQIKTWLTLDKERTRVVKIDARLHDRDYYPGHLEQVVVNAATTTEQAS